MMTQFVREYWIMKAQHCIDETGLLAIRLEIVLRQAVKARDYRSVDVEFLGDDASAVSGHRAGESIELGDYEIVQHCVGSRALLMEWGILPANSDANMATSPAESVIEAIADALSELPVSGIYTAVPSRDDSEPPHVTVTRIESADGTDEQPLGPEIHPDPNSPFWRR